MPIPRSRLSYLIAALLLVVVVGGAILGWRVLRRVDAATSVQAVVIAVSAPGRSAEAVEAEVTGPIETQLARVGDLCALRTFSMQGAVFAMCELGRSADGLAAVDRIRSSLAPEQLPKDVTVTVSRFTPASELLRYAITHEQVALLELRRRNDSELRPAIERVAGVQSVETCGVGEAEVQVGLDPVRLSAFGLTVDGVRDAVERALAMPAEGEDSLGLRNLPLGTSNGKPVKLADVASVRIGTSPHRCACMVSGAPALCVTVRGTDAAGRPGATAAQVRQVLTDWASKEAGVRLHLSTDDPASAHTRVTQDLWAAGEFRRDQEGETVRIVGRAVQSIAGDLTSVVRVGRYDGAAQTGLEPSGEAELWGVETRVAAAWQPRMREAITRSTPWVRTSPGRAAAADAAVRGGDVADLARAARAVRDAVAGVGGVQQAQVLGAGQHAGLDVRIDRDKAAVLGVSPADIARTLQVALQGEVLRGSLRAGDARLAVRLALAEVAMEPEDLALLTLRASSGTVVTLGQVASIQRRAMLDPIVHVGGQRALLVRVWGDSDERDAWLREAQHAAQQAVLPAGCTVTWLR